LLPAGFLAAGLLLAPIAARAQAESREGIYLQNQIFELRQELDQLRGGASRMAPPMGAPRGGAPAAGGGELVSALLERVNQLEEAVRRMRGQQDENDYRLRQMQQTLEKLQGDMDYRLGQIEGGNRQQAAASAAPARPAAPATPAPVAAGPRPPERAIAEGQAALARRDYAAAEAAAREVLAQRNSPRAGDAQMLLAEALLRKGEFGNAALAYNDAYNRSRNTPRAPQALLGQAEALIGLNTASSKRDACSTLDDLRSDYGQALRGSLAERATEARRRAGCR
jgi:TolA-binding protein